jgi:hypothetical protein
MKPNESTTHNNINKTKIIISRNSSAFKKNRFDLINKVILLESSDDEDAKSAIIEILNNKRLK